MIEYVKGDIFNSGCEALVNPVNCVGVMGKGLAAEFKRRYPDYFDYYAWLCEIKWLQAGDIDLYRILPYGKGIIYSFATKTHWRDKSKLQNIAAGLIRLAEDCHKENIKSVALPAVGCGLGGLNWIDVKPLIEAAFQPYPEIAVKAYEPN